MPDLPQQMLKQPVRAVRLSISRLTTGWAVTAEKKIKEMRLPRHHELPTLGREQVLEGSWFEVRDRNKQPVYRRRLNLPNLTEVHTDKGQAARERVVDELLSPIQIIIPDIEQTSYVLLFSTVDYSRGRQTRPISARTPIPFAVFKRVN